jgi:two-component system response regulator TctD
MRVKIDGHPASGRIEAPNLFAAPRLLLVDAETPPAAGMASLFADAGFVVDLVSDNSQAADRALAAGHDLAVLDIDQGDHNGLTSIDQLRNAGLTLPILVVSTWHSAELAALDAGADGFLAKPLVADELLARARALLRRCRDQVPVGATTGIGDMCFDAVAGSFYVRGRRLSLTARQFDLLALLARRPGQIVARRLLTDQLYNGLDTPGASTIDVFVHAIRQRLAAIGSTVKINTVRGVGFCLVVGT